MTESRFYPLPLNKIYKLAVEVGPEAKLEDVMSTLRIRSKRTAQQYLRTLKWMAERVENVGTLDEFSRELLTVLLEEFKLEEALNLLMKEKIPLTPSGMASALKEAGIEVSKTEARAIISWLKHMDALKERRVPVLTVTLEDRVLEEVRQRGSVTYGTLVKSYGDGVRDVVVQLWRKGYLSVPVLEEHRDLLMEAENLDKLPSGLKGRIFATWQDRISGETYSELVIPSRARIEARWSL